MFLANAVQPKCFCNGQFVRTVFCCFYFASPFWTHAYRMHLPTLNFLRPKQKTNLQIHACFSPLFSRSSLFVSLFLIFVNFVQWASSSRLTEIMCKEQQFRKLLTQSGVGICPPTEIAEFFTQIALKTSNKYEFECQLYRDSGCVEIIHKSCNWRRLKLFPYTLTNSFRTEKMHRIITSMSPLK